MTILIPWNRLGGSSGISSTMSRLSWGWIPAIDVKDRELEVVVCVELPGMRAEDIEIAVCSNTLQISGERREEEGEAASSFYVRERRYGSFQRNIELPGGTAPDMIRAEYRDGELNIHIPKVLDSRHRIAVTAGEGNPGPVQARLAEPKYNGR